MKNPDYKYKSYLYYIFMDDDIDIRNNFLPRSIKNKVFNKQVSSIIQQQISPWRKYENFLFQYRPAIGTVENHSRMAQLKFLSTTKLKPYYSSINFDAQVNGFHKDSIRILLPYNETLDKRSWWISQQLLTCKALFRFHAQVIMFLPLLAINSDHRTYPRGLLPLKEACWKEYNLAPTYLKKYNLLQRLMNCNKYSDLPIFLNYVAPPRTPIKQYMRIVSEEGSNTNFS